MAGNYRGRNDGAAKTSIFNHITGLFASKDGGSMSVLVDESIVKNLADVQVGDKLILFDNGNVVGKKPKYGLKFIRSTDLEERDGTGTNG